MFVFTRNDGDYVITGFDHGADKVDLTAFHFANFAAVSAMMHNHVGAVERDLAGHGGGSVDFTGLTAATLTAGDFLL